MSGFRGEVVFMKKCTHALTDDGQKTVTIAHSELKNRDHVLTKTNKHLKYKSSVINSSQDD